jgi:hypothetical protein
MKDPLAILLPIIIVTCILAMGYIAGNTGSYTAGYADGRAQAHQDIIDYCEHISQDL